MSVKSYLNFDLLLNEAGESYQVHVDSPAGQTSHPFTLPFSELELENFILKVGQNRSGVRSLGLESVDMPSVKKLGGGLYDSLFGGDVSKLFYTSLAIAEGDGRGLRIRLRLSGASNLINIPWELLFDPASSDYLGLSVNTPIIRKLDLARQPRVRPAAEVLRVLVMISSPAGFYPLNVEEEWDRINTATQSLQAEGRLILERVKPSLDELQQRLGRGEYHIFHYVGHGGFDSQSNDGVLVLENDENKGKFVSGQDLGALLRDEITLQLVLLNSCNGGRTSVRYPFAGVGQSLLQKGIPAVIAMQFEITDDAAIAFSHAFYSALADGYPIDTAVAEARKMIFAKGNPLEWATPVLYTSIDSGSLLREPTPEKLKLLEAQRHQKEEIKLQPELNEEDANNQVDFMQVQVQFSEGGYKNIGKSHITESPQETKPKPQGIRTSWKLGAGFLAAILAGVVAVYVVKPPPNPTPVVTEKILLGVVYGADTTIADAKYEVLTRASNLGLTNAAIYLKQNRFRSVVTTTDEALAQQFLQKVNNDRVTSKRTPELVKMLSWCPYPTKKVDPASKVEYFECSSGGQSSP